MCAERLEFLLRVPDRLHASHRPVRNRRGSPCRPEARFQRPLQLLRLVVLLGCHAGGMKAGNETHHESSCSGSRHPNPDHRHRVVPLSAGARSSGGVPPAASLHGHIQPEEVGLSSTSLRERVRIGHVAGAWQARRPGRTMPRIPTKGVNRGSRIPPGIRDPGRRHKHHQLRRCQFRPKPRGRPRRSADHTAGFDHEAGVFRIFDVWETREHGERFISEKLNPIIERMAAEAAGREDESFTPPTRETWYDLHDSMTG